MPSRFVRFRVQDYYNETETTMLYLVLKIKKKRMSHSLV